MFKAAAGLNLGHGDCLLADGFFFFFRRPAADYSFSIADFYIFARINFIENIVIVDTPSHADVDECLVLRRVNSGDFTP